MSGIFASKYTQHQGVVSKYFAHKTDYTFISALFFHSSLKSGNDFRIPNVSEYLEQNFYQGMFSECIHY